MWKKPGQGRECESDTKIFLNIFKCSFLFILMLCTMMNDKDLFNYLI